MLTPPAHRNKKGLLKATNNLANEIMLLGVASLLLMACTPALTRVCTPKEHTFKPWLYNVKPCACCLSRTKGVSPCFLKARPLSCNTASQAAPAAAAACVLGVQTALDRVTHDMRLAKRSYVPSAVMYWPSCCMLQQL
jgi:hypothetical protein